jgi:SAM-dependent methyltransferase
MHFTDTEIQEIYETKVKKPPSYFTKYYNLPSDPLPSWTYSWEMNDFPRIWILLDFKEWVTKYNLTQGAILASTHAQDPELEFLSYETIIHLPYPVQDLHKPLPHINTYDFFVFNQTLEHLYNPQLALKNIYAAVKPGGYVFTSVPVFSIPHLTPFHYAGFTPMGLAMLFLTAGFEVCEIGQWGNYKYITKLFGTHTFKSYHDLHTNNCVENEPENACQTWILARKPPT